MYVKNNLKPTSWHRVGEDVCVFRKREFKNNQVRTQEIAISKRRGLLRDASYYERLYSKTRISQLLKKVGFKNIKIKKDVSLHKIRQDFGFLTSRIFVTATKPGKTHRS